MKILYFLQVISRIYNAFILCVITMAVRINGKKSHSVEPLRCERIIREKTEHLEKEPEDIKCRVELAAALYQSYRFEEAVDLLLQVPAPENPIRRAGYYNYMGRSLLSIHRTEEALPALQSWEEAIRSIPEADTSEEAIAVRKRHGYALTLIGVGYMQKKEYDTARTYIESAKGMHHDEYFVTLEESCVLEYLSGNYVESIEACKELELRAPQSFQSSNIRAKCCFRLGLLEKSGADRDVIEKVSDDHARSVGRSDLLEIEFHGHIIRKSGQQLIGRPDPGEGVAGLCDHLHLGDSRNAGESFPAKSQAHQPGEVAVIPDLAGGVPLKRLGNLAFFNAAAVVGDADHLLTALPDLAGYGLCPGVNGVFNQFFDHVDGPLDHFAGRYSIDCLFAQ